MRHERPQPRPPAHRPYMSIHTLYGEHEHFSLRDFHRAKTKTQRRSRASQPCRCDPPAKPPAPRTRRLKRFAWRLRLRPALSWPAPPESVLSSLGRCLFHDDSQLTAGLVGQRKRLSLVMGCTKAVTNQPFLGGLQRLSTPPGLPCAARRRSSGTQRRRRTASGANHRPKVDLVRHP